MKKVLLLLTIVFFTTQSMFAQRYVEEIFDDVTVTEDQVYGVNATVLALTQVGQAIPQPLLMDVYEPTGDTETNRPLAIVVHTGNFLPPTFNGGCGGTQKDADVVETAKRLARMGYVAACIDYRLGWDPVNPDQTIRTFTIINASYRGLQDLNTSVKFFRKTVTEDGNPFGIDPEKIMSVGYGTGAYVTYGSSTVGSAMETWTGPFITGDGPMVVGAINGDPAANTVGIVPDGYPGFPVGDTLCYPNHVGYDHKTNLAVQFGGANGDVAWVTEDDTPMMSFHVLTDPFAPCDNGIVNVPPPVNLPVVEVYGGCSTIAAANEAGINDIINNVDYDDPYTAAASSTPGLYLFYSDDPTESSPWNYAYSTEPYGVTGSDCPTWTQEIQDVRDTCINYLIPRACVALDLGCDLSDFTNIDQLEDAAVGLEIAPNPADEFIRISTVNEPMTDVYVFDMQGQIVRAHTNIHDYQFQLDKQDLASGMYLTMVRFAEGYVTKKVMFE